MEKPECFGLPEQTIERIKQVFAKFKEIDSAILYGSRAKGNYRPGSDIDLTLTANTPTSLKLLHTISNALDNLDLPYKIDLSFIDMIDNPELIEHINRVGKIFYQHSFL